MRADGSIRDCVKRRRARASTDFDLIYVPQPKTERTIIWEKLRFSRSTWKALQKPCPFDTTCAGSEAGYEVKPLADAGPTLIVVNRNKG